MPARVSRSAIQGADGPIRTPAMTVDVNRPHRSGASMVTGAARSGPSMTSGGDGSTNGTPRWAARSRATPRCDQASGRLRVMSRSKTASAVTPSASNTGGPSGQLGREQQDAGVVVAEAELARRAQHPVRPLAPHLAPADLHAVGHGGAQRGQRHEIAGGHVEGAAHDLQRLAVAGVDVDQVDLVGVGMRARSPAPGPRSRPRPVRRRRSTSSTAMPRALSASAERVDVTTDGRELVAARTGATVVAPVRTAPGSGRRW